MHFVEASVQLCVSTLDVCRRELSSNPCLAMKLIGSPYTYRLFIAQPLAEKCSEDR